MVSVQPEPCGVDEAGRGPIAGPVFAAAVILDPLLPIEGLRDSKLLTERRRTALAEEIRCKAMSWCIASATVDEIDRLNILQATLLAMQRAITGLTCNPSLALVDGNRAPVCDVPIKTIVKGDQTVPAISAASILAKTARDKEMLRLHLLYPEYGLSRHKGYPTAEHLAAIAEHGIRDIHRISFRPVREVALLGKSAAFGR